jgi:hypothetical protein
LTALPFPTGLWEPGLNHKIKFFLQVPDCVIESTKIDPHPQGIALAAQHLPVSVAGASCSGSLFPVKAICATAGMDKFGPLHGMAVSENGAKTQATDVLDTNVLCP